MSSWETLSPFKKLSRSRKFLLLCVDTIVSLATWIVGAYFLDAKDAVIFVIATLQPVFIFLIGAIAYEDVNYLRNKQNGV